MEKLPLKLDPRLGRQADVARADTGLLIVDSQVRFCTRHGDNTHAVERALDHIVSLRETFDDMGLPTFLVFQNDLPEKPDPKARPAYLGPEKGDSFYRQSLTGNFEIVAKHGNSVFHYSTPDARGKKIPTRNTWLRQCLQADYPNIRRFVVCGFNTSACVTDTVLDAADQKFNMIVASDACADTRSGDGHTHDVSLMAMAEYNRVRVTRSYDVEMWVLQGMRGPLELAMPRSIRALIPA